MVNYPFWVGTAYLTIEEIYQTRPVKYLMGGFRCETATLVFVEVIMQGRGGHFCEMSKSIYFCVLSSGGVFTLANNKFTKMDIL